MHKGSTDEVNMPGDAVKRTEKHDSAVFNGTLLALKNDKFPGGRYPP